MYVHKTVKDFFLLIKFNEHENVPKNSYPPLLFMWKGVVAIFLLFFLSPKDVGIQK